MFHTIKTVFNTTTFISLCFIVAINYTNAFNKSTEINYNTKVAVNQKGKPESINDIINDIFPKK